MNVTQLLARLSRGPLSNLAISNDGDGTILETRIPAIIDYANEGLLRLHSRFVLHEKEVILEQQEAVTSYRLHSDNAVSAAGESPFIIDTVEDPFIDDLLKIQAIYKTGGCQVALNDANNCHSLHTPQFDLLQVPNPCAGAPLYIIYQAAHPTLNVPNAEEPVEQEIVLPPVLEEALISYVAYKVYDSMNGQEHVARAVSHLNQFDTVCVEVLARDLVNSSLSNTNTKFCNRGFV